MQIPDDPPAEVPALDPEDLESEEFAEFLEGIETAAGGPVDVATHAYEFLNTSTDFSENVQFRPGLQTYIMIPEREDSSDLFTALFESTESLETVLETTEFTISQINVFYIPIKDAFEDSRYEMGAGTVPLVMQGYDHDWASRALSNICDFASDRSSCEGLSGGPYFISTLTPIHPEDSEDPAPSEFVIWDMGEVEDRTSWSKIISAYKSAVIDAETLIDLRESGEEFTAEQLKTLIEERVSSSGEFPQGLVLRTLTTTGGCTKTWNCRIVCEQ